MGSSKGLLVCDSVDGSERIASQLAESGVDIAVVPSSICFDLLGHADFGVVVLHFATSKDSNVGMIRKIREVAPETEIIISASQPSIDAVIDALREKVLDYVRFPEEVSRLPLAVQHAIDWRQNRLKERLGNIWTLSKNGSEPEVEPPAATLPTPASSICRAALVGENPAIEQVRALIEEVAHSDITVLIRGESGTGKDIVARLIHGVSSRSRLGTFVKINCPAIPESLFESELFGYEKGAFTGATTHKPGRFEFAEKGTLFLDEIGSVSAAMQSKLLEAVEHKQFTRVGGTKPIAVDARIICATNSPLEEMIAKGTFRLDLFYRLKQFTITLPPLRERREDIPLLCQHFLQVYARKYGMREYAIPTETMAQLLRYDWPGNVRELEAVIARFALSGDPESIRIAVTSDDPAASQNGVDRLDQAEIAAILSALAETAWNRRKAAVRLGISYAALRRRIAKYNISASDLTVASRSRGQIAQ